MSNPDDRDPAIQTFSPKADLAPRPRGEVDRADRRRAPATPTSNGMPNALELLKALRHRWGLGLGLGLLCAALAASATWAILPAAEYSAHALLHVSERQPQIIFPTNEAESNFATYQQTQLTWLKSRLVLNAALRDEEVASLGLDRRHPDPIAWLEEQIRANYSGEVLRISMSGPVPGELATLVNAVTNAYLEEVVNKDVIERRKRHEDLQELYLVYQGRLEEKRKRLKDLSEQLGSSDRKTLQFAQELALERREIAKQELMQIGLDLQRLRIEAAVQQESSGPVAAPGDVPGAAIGQQVAEDPALVQYDAQIAELRGRIEQYRRVIRSPSDPAIREVERAISRLKDQRAARAELLRARGAQQPWEVVTAGGGDLLALQKQIRILEELEGQLRSEVEGMDVETRKFSQETWMLDQVQDELAQIDAAAKKIGSEVEALNVELGAPPRVALVEQAENPRLQDDKRPKMAGMAGVGAFGLALLGVSLIEYRTRRIHSIDEIVGGLQLRLIGALPALPGRSGRVPAAGSEADARWRSVLLESVDAMRTLLLRASAFDSVRSVMITSAVAAEGKTSLASHLATSLARAGRRTLLVDCDLRKPDVHRLFDVTPGPGLGELLRGEVDLDAAVHPSPAADLWILPAGDADDLAIQALSQPGAEAIFRRLRGQFDFVVVDTAPVLPVADALLVGQYVDGAIYSVLRSTSRIPKVLAAGERLRSVGVPILGAVMTGVQGDPYGSHYSYAYSCADPGPARAASAG